MSYPITENDQSVISLVGVEIRGNITPPSWHKFIRLPNGKPDPLAIHILADIVWWYRPVEKRDETTGAIVGYEKKFAADKLQRSYQATVDLFNPDQNEDDTGGYTKLQVKKSYKLLQDLELIDIEFRTIETDIGQKLSNVMFVGLNVPKLLEFSTPLCTLKCIPSTLISAYPMHFKVHTYTEITNTKNNNIPDLPICIEENCKRKVKWVEENKGRCSYCAILGLWNYYMPPNKPRHRRDNTTLARKATTRMNNDYFRENWRTALQVAKDSSFLTSGNWFDLNWFLANDTNWRKVLNGNYIQSNHSTNGQGGNKKEQMKDEFCHLVGFYGRPKYQEAVQAATFNIVPIIQHLGGWSNVCDIAENQLGVKFYMALNEVRNE